MSNMKEEISQLSIKLKEEAKRLEINKRKLDAKDAELEDFRLKILSDNNKSSATINEFNEELEERDKKISDLRRQMRLLVHKQQAVAAI